MHRTVLALVLSALPAIAASQNATRATHTIRGVVYDSIAHAPLAGAIVQAALADSTVHDKRLLRAPSRTFTAVSDSTGSFHLDGLPAGQLAVGFQHDALSASGIESPIMALDLSADTTMVIVLAIPSGQTIRRSLCPKIAANVPDAALVSYVVDATSGTPAKDARVTVQWMELNLRRGVLQSSPRGISAEVGDDGRYVACRIPTDGPVTVRTDSKTLRAVEAEVTLSVASVGRRDFRLSASNDLRGTGSIILRVVDDSGAVI
jgi:hypothetical protein